MKLFAMRGEDAVDVLIDIADPVQRVIADKNTAPVVAKLEKLLNAGLHPIGLYPLLVVTIKPLLKDHKADLFAIAAGLTGKTIDEIAEQSLPQTMRDVRDVWDEDMRAFFISSASMAADE